MANNSSQSDRPQDIGTSVKRGDSFTSISGPDGRGNEQFTEVSTGPSKSNAQAIKADGTTTEYTDQSREWKVGKEIKDQDKIAILMETVNGQILFKADKSKIDVIARGDINLYSEKGDITLTAPTGKIVFGSKEIRTGDLFADPVTGSKGIMPKIMMNSMSGGNFCGVKLPHSMCLDFIKPMRAGASRGRARTTSTTADVNVSTPRVPGPYSGPWDNPNVRKAWQRCDPLFSPAEAESESGADFY